MKKRSSRKAVILVTSLISIPSLMIGSGISKKIGIVFPWKSTDSSQSARLVTSSRNEAEGDTLQKPIPAGTQSASPSASDMTDTNQLTDKKALQILARFNEKMNQISKEDYQRSESRINSFLANARKAEKAKPEPPAESLYVDQNGQQWTKLEFPSGEVRYEFPK